MNFSAPLTQENMNLMLAESTYEAVKYKYPEALEHLEKRLNYIVEFIANKVGDSFAWYDFENFSERRDGYFSPAKCQDGVGIHIKFDREPKYTSPLFTKIPLSYFTSAMEKEVAYEIEKAIEDDIIQRRRAVEYKKTEHIRVNKLIESIKSKLSPEELAIVQFKKVK